MPRALNLLRAAIPYRRDAFSEGLKRAGFELVDRVDRVQIDDLVIVWNRYGGFHEEASRFERGGGAALVVENGPLGKSWRGGEWFSLATGHHAGAGDWKPGGPERWDSWRVELEPWRAGGQETVILAQRGIGEPGIRSPERWAEVTQRRIGGRVRQHPQDRPPTVSLLEDLRNARQVVTWHSGAALLALMAGIPVWYGFPQWIGAGAARPLSEWPGEPLRSDAARLQMFRRMAWSMWQLDEIRTGEPIRRLLETVDARLRA